MELLAEKHLENKYSNNHKAIIRTRERRTFLLNCRKNRITPKFIQNRTKNLVRTNVRNNKDNNNFIYYVNRKILSFEISDAIKTLYKLNKIKKYLRLKMFMLAPQHITNNFINHTKNGSINYTLKLQENINNKYNSLLIQQTPKIEYNPDWIKNLSQTHIPKEIECILSYGPKFSVHQIKNEIPLTKIILDVEEIIKNNKDDTIHNYLRGKFSTIVSNHYHKTNNNSIDRKKFILNKAYKSTKQFLRNNPDLIVTSADKGNTTIIMNKLEYDNKIENHYNNQDFRKLHKDPTERLQNKNNTIVRELFKNNFIDKISKKRLLIFTAEPPRPHCTPKLHKPGIRIIVNSINSPSYKMAKYLNILLKTAIQDNKFNIKNSYDLKHKLDHISISNDEIMTSFDVVAMYDRIPIEEVINSLEKRKDLIMKVTKIPWEYIIKMVKFCARECNYVVWNGQPYQQKEGLTIGGAVSGMLADLVITDLLDTAIYQSGIDLKLVVKYVDDTLMIIPKEEFENFLTILNTQHPRIKFTYETEDSNKIPFLDLMLHRTKNGKIETSLYKKPTSNNRMLNFNSAHPKSQLCGTAFGFITRALNVTSQKYRTHTIEHINEALKENGYPSSIISKLLEKYEKQQTQTQIYTPIEPKYYKSLTYTPHLSENLKQLFQSHDKNLQISFKPYSTNRKIFNNQILTTDTKNRHGVVYKFTCNNCPGTYVGHTGQKLKDRLSQHKQDLNKKHNSTNQTAAIQHVLQTGHSFNYDDCEIIGNENHLSKRLTLESIHINLNKSTSINLRDDINKLNPAYISTLNLIKKPSNSH